MKTYVLWFCAFIAATLVSLDHGGSAGVVTWLALLTLAEIELNTRKP